jgi:hypothetical protein
MFTYFSPQYREKYSEKVSTMIDNAGQVFVNEQIYDTVLGIIGVDTTEKENNSDLTSPEFESHDKIFRGRKSVYDSDNNAYRTKNRISELMAPGNTSPLKISLGSIGHPFHLSYVNGKSGYPFLSLDIYEESDQLWMKNLSHYPLSIATAVRYIDLPASQDIFVNFTLAENYSGNAETSAQRIVDALSALDCAQHCQLIVSTGNIAVARAIKKMGLQVSLLLNGNSTESEIQAFEFISVNENELASLGQRISQKRVTVVNPSCDFLTCNPVEIESRLKQEFGSNPVERVIAPVHDL